MGRMAPSDCAANDLLVCRGRYFLRLKIRICDSTLLCKESNLVEHVPYIIFYCCSVSRSCSIHGKPQISTGVLHA